MYDVVHEADTVVVGAGAAGCVLAARLSEDPARRVVLIEAGPHYPTLDQLPEDLRDGWRSAGSHDWSFRDEATGAAVARARVVGGCSATNGAIALRGTVRDFDGWAARGNPGWSYAEVLPAFRKLEDDHDFVDRWHGQGGPLPIRRYCAKELTAVNAAAYEAAAQAGFPEVADHNRPGTTGLGHAPVNTIGGVRISAALTYLAQARSRPNLVLLANALVDRVLMNNRRAVGVLLVDGRIVRADRVVLAAGTYGSPALLLRSGIGPADGLRALGIGVRADLPGVGANLQEHPGVSVIWPLGRAQPDGPRFQVVATWRSGSDEEADHDMQHVPAGAPQLFWVSASVMTPRSRGTVKLASADPAVAPRIRLNLLHDPLDLARMIEGVRSARRIGARKPLADLASGPEQWAGAGIEDDGELANAVKAAVWPYHHAAGTCAMGPSPAAGAVVDATGSVHGVEALAVADASIMPVIPAANIHLTTLMIAERIAELLSSSP
ncbi:MAG TPA: GMC family oxidoreductase N-terminal domain-containing protein [Actinocrinis sp.]|nr:GMC family oxidoreductase N-terminal domain-containing protein [Actinocrinis sp.]